MGDEVDSHILKSTQNSLGKFVKRPPLSEKLLKKPPFRFIHDIITTILKTTGFFNDLFDENELISDNVKDRESKILFLNKVIYVVATTTGKTLSVKPSKVIAGQEPEKTNELLQSLAYALDNNLSSDEAVAQYKQSLTKSVNSDKKNSKEIKKVTRENSNLKLSTKSVTKNDTSTVVKPKQKEVKKKESPPKKVPQSGRSIKKPTEGTKDNGHNKKRITGKSPDRQNVDSVQTSNKSDITLETTRNRELSLDETKLLDNTSTEAEKNIIINKTIITTLDLDTEDLKNTENDVPSKEQPTKSSGDESKITAVDSSIINIKDNTDSFNDDIYEKKKQENYLSNTNNVGYLSKSIESRDNSIETSLNEIKTSEDVKVVRPLSMRPSSSRPGAPRLREKHEESLTDSDNLLIGKVNIISENTVQEEDEESSIVIIENDVPKSEIEGELRQLDGNEHGHLVQQIINSQKEFSQVSGKTEIEWQFGAKKARDVINQEIDQLRFNLQALSRVANPLGKLLDHIQEDVEVMRQEAHFWYKTYEDSLKELRKQKKSNEEKLKPLHSKIRTLNNENNEKQEKINDLKITIYKNALRIDKLLMNGNKQ